MAVRLAGLLAKELIQFFRDRIMLVLILWLYTVEVVICAVALSFAVHDLPLALVDLDHSPASRALATAFAAGDAFRVTARPASETGATAALQAGTARTALIIPEHFTRRLARGEPAEVQLLVDGSNSTVAAQARAYALEIVQDHARDQAYRLGGPAARPPLGVALRSWYNPAADLERFTVLSMIALAALMVGVIHPAASIVREREIGTLEQLRVTPIGTAELFIAKTLPTLLMGLLAVFPSLLIARLFDVPLAGSLGLFLAYTAAFLGSAIGLGVLVAAIARTLQQALLLAFFGLFPLMFLSGTLAPVESMPEFLQRASVLSPLRHYMDVILGIFLKGAGLAELWPQGLALLAIGTALYAAAWAVFRREFG
jgi:ABC-2 type transport system permease protein